ncbi:universal stress protein [Emticicia sp. BO119]|uniref:universal stress protein n=1 Tax=Emticicia sp. BO119 TaxID=2757768 RepID=UPI0015F009DA|nr:universal stress protein [Emticicia sp. BO119]MBA4848963.1 universal stress protein [Emticicia sp. BO119]
MKKILLATNFSKSSEKAIQYAFHQFGDTPCEFTLMHACDKTPLYGSAEIAFNLMGELYLRAKEKLSHQLKEIKKLDTREIHSFKTEFIATSTGRAIEILNRKHPYDFVVVGASGKGEDILFGSTATEVILNTNVNTVVVPSELKPGPVKNVVLAVDYLPVQSFSQFDSLKEFLLEREAQLTLLTIITDNTLFGERDSQTRDQYINYFEPLSIATDHIWSSGIEAGIMEYLQFKSTDLLVMLTRHHSFYDVIFNRSVTRKFAFNPTLPLISISDTITIDTKMQLLTL